MVAERLLDAGCRVLMPWAAPIGSGRGLNNLFGLRALRAHFPEVPLIIDAGIGTPSHAAAAMELGFDAVLINTAIAQAAATGRDGARFCARGRGGAGRAIWRGRSSRATWLSPSTPVIGKAFLG